MSDTVTLSFQGALGAYSHLACQVFEPGCMVAPCVDFADAIRAVHDGRSHMACLPLDNSIAGRVADMHFLLPTSGLRIIAEHFLPIRHCALGVKGATLAGVTAIHSHVHALPQCRKFIAQMGWTPVVASDTAASAQMVAEWNNPTQASIASALAGEIYGLEVLAADIADSQTNTTRFVLMAPMASEAAHRLPDPAVPCLTSFVFQVRSMPAALYKALGGFATNGLNLVKLESYMNDDDFNAARFYAEVEGHPDTMAMQHAMEELAFFAEDIVMMGTYRRDGFRQN